MIESVKIRHIARTGYFAGASCKIQSVRRRDPMAPFSRAPHAASVERFKTRLRHLSLTQGISSTLSRGKGRGGGPQNLDPHTLASMIRLSSSGFQDPLPLVRSGLMTWFQCNMHWRSVFGGICARRKQSTRIIGWATQFRTK